MKPKDQLHIENHVDRQHFLYLTCHYGNICIVSLCADSHLIVIILYDLNKKSCKYTYTPMGILIMFMLYSTFILYGLKYN